MKNKGDCCLRLSESVARETLQRWTLFILLLDLVCLASVYTVKCIYSECVHCRSEFCRHIHGRILEQKEHWVEHLEAWVWPLLTSAMVLHKLLMLISDSMPTTLLGNWMLLGISMQQGEQSKQQVLNCSNVQPFYLVYQFIEIGSTSDQIFFLVTMPTSSSRWATCCSWTYRLLSLTVSKIQEETTDMCSTKERLIIQISLMSFF